MEWVGERFNSCFGSIVDFVVDVGFVVGDRVKVDDVVSVFVVIVCEYLG